MKARTIRFLFTAIFTIVALMAAQPAWADNVQLSEDNDFTPGTLGHRYVNLPATGTNTLTLANANVTSFKVYDNGGKGGGNNNAAGNYSDSCNGYLIITAPSGYVLRLSGSITAEKSDKLTVYDGSQTTANKLLDAVSSINQGIKADIATVISTGNSIMLIFKSDSSLNYAGLDLTVTLISTSTPFDITFETYAGGTVSASVGGSPVSSATINQTVTLTATPENGYVLTRLWVGDSDSRKVNLDWTVWTNSATFTMPASGVTVIPTFTNDMTSLSVNMSEGGPKSASIPAGVQSFKVYDCGGTSYYWGNRDSYLTLTAPSADYVLQLSGDITTKTGDKLTVFDGNNDSASRLLDRVSSPSDGTQTAIPTVVSSGQTIMLYFDANGENSKFYAGLDLTVTLVSAVASYDVTVNPVTGGSVAASINSVNITSAQVGETVTLTAIPGSGHMLSGISVKDGSNNDVAVTWDGPFYNTASFIMPGSAVTVIPTFTDDLTVNNLYVNLPFTGAKTAIIPAGVQSFKVYDNGGPDHNYNIGCDGYLTLTAPSGCKLQISGSIKTGSIDKLTVYDNSEASGTKLIDEMTSSYSDVLTDIPTVNSSGQNMTLRFNSYSTSSSAGLYLTVTVFDAVTPHTVTVNNPDPSNGCSVSASPTSAAGLATVTLTASPAGRYVLSGISVKDGNNDDVDVDWSVFSNTATFSMPATDVTVTPTFTNNLTYSGLSVNMPKTGTKTVSIPAGVRSFKVYDDGGPNGNYSDKCDGYLTITAPAGFKLQLSGKIWTDIYEELTVFGNSITHNDKLYGPVHSYQNNTQADIGTITSTGQTMTIRFKTNISNNFAGLDLTVTLVPNPTQEEQTLTLTARQARFAGQTHYWTTFFHPNYNYKLTAGSLAFIMNSERTLYCIGDGSLIPAGCAVVIMTESDSVTLDVTTDDPSGLPDGFLDANILRGVSTDTEKTNVHVISKDSYGTFGFYLFTGTVPAGKAYFE